MSRSNRKIGMDAHSDDPSVIKILRLALDEVFSDRRFFARKSMSACQVADYILTLVSQGERDLDLIKASAFKKLSGDLPAQQRLHSKG
jgi:hypothetical protein